MGRIRQVTRSVEITTSVVLVCNTATREVREISVETPTALDDKHTARAIEKACKAVNPDFAVVATLSASVREVLYAMDESDFLRLATKLPPRGAKGEGVADE